MLGIKLCSNERKKKLANWLAEEAYNSKPGIEVLECVSSHTAQHPSLAILK